MWVYVPSECCPSAPEPPDLTSASSWPFQVLAQSASWNGRQRPAKFWRRACRKVPWLRRLCGAILEPSTASRGVASWIASLAASPASPPARPASGQDQQTTAGSGPTPCAWCARFSPSGCSSRTCPVLLLEDSRRLYRPSSMSFAKWVMRLRRDSSRRRKSARRISASGCSCWPTATVPDGGRLSVEEVVTSKGNMPQGKRQVSLEAATAHWQTPQTPAGGGKVRGGERGDESLLPGQAEQTVQWMTPSVETGAWMRDQGQVGKERLALEGHAQELWVSPRASENENRMTHHAPSHDGSQHGQTLAGQAGEQQWATPNAEKGGPNQSFGTGGVPLAAQAASVWATPTTQDAANNGAQGQAARNSPPLNVQCLPGPPAPATAPAGEPSSSAGPGSPPPSARSRPKLSPAFVEWLMGWPEGWSDSGSAVTGLSAWSRRWRGWLWRLLCAWRDDFDEQHPMWAD